MAVFGIDFGTTNSATTEWLNGQSFHHSERAGKPFPSLVAIDKITGEVVASGLEVRERRSHYQNQCEIISSPKTYLGTDHSWRIGNRVWTPRDVAREIFRGLKKVVAKRSNLVEAVVAIPVGFAPSKRKELRQAALEAGIQIKGFVSEPTAAVFRNLAIVSRWRKCVVFDWGGGTLDISVLELDRGNIRELEAIGIPLGGDDLDRKIAEWAYNKHLSKTGESTPFHELDASSKDGLLVACEIAKCDLGNNEEHTIYRPNFYNGRDLEVKLDRKQFQILLEGEYTMAINTLHQAVSVRAKLSYEEIGCILMVGGSSKLAGLHQRIQSKIGDCEIIPPDEEADWHVAHGASILAATPGTYILADNLGVELSDGSFFPLAIHGNPSFICNGSLNFGIVEDAETACFNFIKSSTDNPDPTMSKISRRVGTLLVPCNGFVNESINLKYTIDDNLTFSVVTTSNHNSTIKHRAWDYENILFTYSLPAEGSYY